MDAPLPPPASTLNSSANLASAEPGALLTQPVTEQVVDAAPTVAEVLQTAATDASLAELGLGSYTPVGLIQNLLEFMHVDLGLPWWGAIVAGKRSGVFKQRALFYLCPLLPSPSCFCQSLAPMKEPCWPAWQCFQS